VRYIIRPFQIGCLAALAGCGTGQSGTITAPDDEPSEYRIDEASGETSMVIATPRGKATMRSGKTVPVQLPSGFSLYPGSAIVSSTVVDQPDGHAIMVMFEADGSAADIIAHFRSAADAAGYAIEIAATMNETMLLSAKRAADGASLVVSTGPVEEGMTPGQIVLGERKRR
jgi:hypothetical protein